MNFKESRYVMYGIIIGAIAALAGLAMGGHLK